MTSPWAKFTIVNDLWRKMPPSRKRVRYGKREVLIYDKAHGTHWASMDSLNGKQLLFLESERVQ